jgi:ABC-type Fe3+/spermidine/putrescine transport system ATPase subunit
MSSSAEKDHLRVEGLALRLRDFALSGITLACRRGGYHVLMGPTGSGKTTLLRTLLGFHRPEGGRIFLGGRNITAEDPERRGMGYVPQSYSLFWHLNVEANVRFGLRARGISRREADRVTRDLLGMLRIEHLRGRDVRNLSGGEKQKVALGRALAVRPEVILLDEPFSSIDEGGRRDLWFDMKRVIDEVGITAVHVTHNLEEAFTLGERFFVLMEGALAQAGERHDIFERPANESVARYLGYRNIFRGMARRLAGGTEIDLGHFRVEIGRDIPEGETTLCIRQQDIRIIRPGQPVKESLRRNVFRGLVTHVFSMPDACVVRFRIAGSPCEFDMEARFPANIRDRYDLHPGRETSLAPVEPRIIIF